METTRKAFGYLRVSGKSQIDGDGFPRQRENILKYAAANGVEISAELSLLAARLITCA